MSADVRVTYKADQNGVRYTFRDKKAREKPSGRTLKLELRDGTVVRLYAQRLKAPATKFRKPLTK